MAKTFSKKFSKSTNTRKQVKPAQAGRVTARRKSAAAGCAVTIPSPVAAVPSAAVKERPNSKQAQVLAALRSPSGTTVDAIGAATGWQQHSVRGFLAGVVRKKLRLDLRSDAGEGGRVYRITCPATAAPSSTKAAKAS